MWITQVWDGATDIKGITTNLTSDIIGIAICFAAVKLSVRAFKTLRQLKLPNPLGRFDRVRTMQQKLADLVEDLGSFTVMPIREIYIAHAQLMIDMAKEAAADARMILILAVILVLHPGVNGNWFGALGSFAFFIFAIVIHSETEKAIKKAQAAFQDGMNFALDMLLPKLPNPNPSQPPPPSQG